MTTPHKALLQQTLDVLGYTTDPDSAHYEDQLAAIAALQAAIDADEPEPVAEVMLSEGEKIIDASMAFFDKSPVGTKLYLHPPAVREPLTEKQLKAIIVAVPEPDDDHVGEWVVGVCRAVEAAVRAKL